MDKNEKLGKKLSQIEEKIFQKFLRVSRMILKYYSWVLKTFETLIYNFWYVDVETSCYIVVGAINALSVDPL